MHEKIIELCGLLNIDPNKEYKAKNECTSGSYANRHDIYSKTFLKKTFGIQPREGEKPCHRAYTQGRDTYDVYQIRQCEPIDGVTIDYTKYPEFLEFMENRKNPKAYMQLMKGQW